MFTILFTNDNLIHLVRPFNEPCFESQNRTDFLLYAALCTCFCSDLIKCIRNIPNRDVNPPT